MGHVDDRILNHAIMKSEIICLLSQSSTVFRFDFDGTLAII